MKSHLKLVTPNKNRTVTPKRKPNADLRTREYLTDREVEMLSEAAKTNRWGHRDATMVLVAYRHGLRASELVDLRWDQIDFEAATLAIRRAKKGTPSTHPIRGDELRALRRLQREQDPKAPFVFTSERGARSPRPDLHEWLSGQARLRSLASRLIRTCYATPAASPWRIRDMIRGLCRPISGTRKSSTRFVIPSCRRLGSRTFGGRRCPARPRGFSPWEVLGQHDGLINFRLDGLDDERKSAQV